MFRILVFMSLLCLLAFWAFLGLEAAAPVRDAIPTFMLTFMQENASDISFLFIQILLISGVISGALAWNLDRQWKKVRDIMLESVRATLANGLRTLRHINDTLENLYDVEDEIEDGHSKPHEHYRDVEHETDPEFGRRVNSIIKAKNHFEDLHDDMYMMLGALQSSLNPHVAIVFANSTESFRHVVVIARIVGVAAKRPHTDDHGRSAKAVQHRVEQIRQHFGAMQDHIIATKTQRILANELWKPLMKEAERTAALLSRHDKTFD